MNTYLRLPDLLLAITLLLGISAIVIPAARRLGIGPELGLLLSGVIMGSSHFLGPTQVERLQELSELGVVFFLFMIGLELDLGRAWQLRRYALGLVVSKSWQRLWSSCAIGSSLPRLGLWPCSLAWCSQIPRRRL